MIFPGVDTVMLKFTWADIEKAEGVYDFTDFDYIYDYWRNRGKTITLGMSADSLLWYGKAGTGVPDYLLQQLPRDRVQVRRSLENPQLLYTLCDAGLPLYQERLSLFLSSCDNHFKKAAGQSGISICGATAYGGNGTEDTVTPIWRLNGGRWTG